MEAGTGKTRGRRRAARLRSKAAGGHFTSGAVEGPSGPPRPQPSVVIPPPSLPLGGPLPDAGRTRRSTPWQGRAGMGRVRGPTAPAAGPRARGGAAGAGADAAAGRSVGGSPTTGHGGREKGEGREPLPILGRSRRRRRPAVGESKVVAGRHFGIFPQPAGHCGGHGESGPMAGGQPSRGRGAEGWQGREKGP